MMLENYITVEETSQLRTPEQFVNWFEGKLSTIHSQKNDLQKQIILHKDIAKFFYEELFPLYRLLQNKQEEWSDVKFSPVKGSQNFDVKVESSRENFMTHIEITITVMNHGEHHRNLYFLEHGHTCITGEVSAKGTKRTGKKISVSNDARKHSELNEEKKEQIRKAFKKKDKVVKRPNDTSLLVYFDDYIAFSNGKDRAEMEDFLNSLDNLWSKKYTSLFVVGASGKGLWERRDGC